MMGYSMMGYSMMGYSMMAHSMMGYSMMGYSMMGYSMMGYSMKLLCNPHRSWVAWRHRPACEAPWPRDIALQSPCGMASPCRPS